MNHIEMMRLADAIAKNSRCPERKVGAVLVSGAHGRKMQAGNSAACDDTNANHAESKLVVMARDARWSLVGATLYTTCRPCARCTETLLPLGLKKQSTIATNSQKWITCSGCVMRVFWLIAAGSQAGWLRVGQSGTGWQDETYLF